MKRSITLLCLLLLTSSPAQPVNPFPPPRVDDPHTIIEVAIGVGILLAGGFIVFKVWSSLPTTCPPGTLVLLRGPTPKIASMSPFMTNTTTVTIWKADTAYTVEEFTDAVQSNTNYYYGILTQKAP